jgi:RND family efflux transporter MFP subunit
VAPDVSGFVTEIRVKDNQLVHKGDVLFVIDQERYKLALAAAEAGVAARRAAMTMQSRIADRRAKLTSLAASEEERDNARLNAEAAKASYEGALVDRSTAELNLKRTVVYAPVTGYVTNFSLVIGQFVPVGARMMAIIESESYHVEGYFEETKLPFLAIGQPVSIQLMGSTGEITGRVESISRGITDRDNTTGPELLAAVTPTFEWVRLAQRIPVRIRIDNVPDGVVVSAGMTCTVVVDQRRATRS